MVSTNHLVQIRNERNKWRLQHEQARRIHGPESALAMEARTWIEDLDVDEQREQRALAGFWNTTPASRAMVINGDGHLTFGGCWEVHRLEFSPDPLRDAVIIRHKLASFGLLVHELPDPRSPMRVRIKFYKNMEVGVPYPLVSTFDFPLWYPHLGGTPDFRAELEAWLHDFTEMLESTCSKAGIDTLFIASSGDWAKLKTSLRLFDGTPELIAEALSEHNLAWPWWLGT